MSELRTDPDAAGQSRQASREYPVAAVSALISDALRSARVSRRHPAEVTSDRLGDAVTRWGGLFTPQELDDLARVRHVLEEIAEGKRGSAR